MSNNLLTNLVQTQVNKELKIIEGEKINTYMKVLDTWIKDIQSPGLIVLNLKIKLNFFESVEEFPSIDVLKQLLSICFKLSIKELVRTKKTVYDGYDTDYGRTIYTCYVVFGDSLDEEIRQAELHLQELKSRK